VVFVTEPAIPFLPSMAELLDLELIDKDLYRGINEVPDNGKPTLFGGQVAAQALKAAGLTVPLDRAPHSMHGYFLRPGWRNRPIIFKVERDRDGRSFSARRVSAVQNGEVIFDLTASFHVTEPSGEYGVEMSTNIPPPDECRPESFGDNFPRAEVRLVPPVFLTPEGVAISSTMWVRVREDLGDDRLNHACTLAYLSDIGTGFSLLDVPNLPRGGPSLDHAMWFRGEIRADQWVLFHMWPLMAGGARGLYGGSMHQADGTLGVMMTQESLVRPTTPSPTTPSPTTP
jgi:acyl-CoA thioesterase II